MAPRDGLDDADRLRVHAERAGLQPAHVEQVLDQPDQPVQRLLGGGEQLVAVLVGERRRRRCAGWPTAALAEASGVRRSWLTADEQGGAHPVGLGRAVWPPRPARPGVPAAGRPRPGRRTPRRRAGRRRRAIRPRRTRERSSSTGTSTSPSAGVTAGLAADAGGDPPRVGVALACPASRGVGAAFEQGDAGAGRTSRGAVPAARAAAGRRAARCRPGWTGSRPRRGPGRPRRVRRAARSTTVLTATATSRKTTRASRFSRSAMVNWCSGGVKK